MKEPIIITVGDSHTMHCMTEGHLDVWWNTLTPDRKAVLFEAELEGLLDPPMSFGAAFTLKVEQTAERMKELFTAPLTPQRMEVVCESLILQTKPWSR